jgi:hypothetical protein
MRALEEDKIHPILMFPLPKTLRQLWAFWRVTGYCRIWILGYADLARPLYQVLKEVQKNPSPLLNGMTREKMHSTSLKRPL